MFIHHWVTVMLIASSWYYGIMNIGALVMVVHDNSDVFLPAAKVSRWFKWNPLLENGLFIIFVLSWIVSRICLFAWKVIIPVFIYVPSAYSCHFDKVIWFVSGLLILFSLHLYWGQMILRIAIAGIMYSKLEDIRSSEDETIEEVIVHPEVFIDDNTENSNVNEMKIANNDTDKVE